ncbi:hypothetical protein IQ266_11065 [filamentous cyanobacterium LEGE 11480]|uniref:Uncharacterized protein n=1 Tax=Romeriopsis navalis LEGE 11480 TaxID=2777977 RepID=A0A928Z2C9_9CYAN|nr:hypothetical protein [Romeriopsis navalis]MBE9030271.1 hypothetical protein [Romeriopsis navalis LEGE 11480]
MNNHSDSQPAKRSDDEFFSGYSRLPKGIKRFLLKFIPLLFVGVVLFGIFVPRVHDQFNPGKFSRGQFEGLLVGEPVPHLLVPRKGKIESGSQFSRYLLSGFSKSSVPAKVTDQIGKWVQIKGAAVHRNNLTVVATGGAKPIERPAGAPLQPEPGVPLGEFSLKGEILDGKCYPGVMKPGQGKTHRACAIRCISGGVPAVFLSHNEQGDPLYFLLADSNGKSVSKQVLDLVADPIQITGQVTQYGDLFLIKADPSTYQRL